MSKIYIIHNNHYLIEDIRKNNKTDATFIRVNFSYNNNIILKVLRKFYIKLKFPFKDIFLNKKELQKYDIKKEDIVIFFDTLADQYLDFSKKIKGKKKLWIWNTTNKKKIIKLKKYFDEIYTFDKKDSLKYNLKYLEQFYWKKQESEKKKKIDLFFIGQDKGRIEFLYNLDYNIKLNNFIYVIRDKFRIYDKKYDKYLRLCHNKQLINSHFYRGVSELPYKLLFAVIYTHLEFRYEMSHTITSHHVHHFHQTRIPDGTLLDYMVQYRKPLFPQFFLYPKKFLPENNPHHKEFHLRPYIQNNANQ